MELPVRAYGIRKGDSLAEVRRKCPNTVIKGGPVELTVEMLLRACADSLTASCEAKWRLVDEAVGAGRLPFCKLPGAFYLIAKRAARRAGTYKDFLAKLPRHFYYRVPDFYVAAPLPVELIHTIMQFADGRTLARFSSCSPQLLVRADIIEEDLYYCDTTADDY